MTPKHWRSPHPKRWNGHRRDAPVEPLSGRIGRLRIARGYSVYELATAAGVLACTIQSLESENSADKRMLAALATALGVPVCRLWRPQLRPTSLPCSGYGLVGGVAFPSDSSAAASTRGASSGSSTSCFRSASLALSMPCPSRRGGENSSTLRRGITSSDVGHPIDWRSA